MSFQGDVRGIGLAELLQGLARGRKDGVLSLSARGGAQCTLGLAEGKVYLLPNPEEDAEFWRDRVRNAWAADPTFRVDYLRMSEIARAQRLEDVYNLLDGDGVHFRFEPGAIPVPSANQPANADEEETPTNVHCEGMAVESLLLEYARLGDELASREGSNNLPREVVPYVLDPDVIDPTQRFVQEIDGRSTLQEICDRMGWPLRQGKFVLWAELARGALRLAEPVEMLGLGLFELGQKNLTRAATRLESWCRYGEPGPLPLEQAQALANEWIAGRLPTALHSMSSHSIRTLLRRMDHALKNNGIAIVHWEEATRKDRRDRIARLHWLACQFKEGNSERPDVRDLLDLAREFREAGFPVRGAPALVMAAHRQPKSVPAQLEVGLGLVGVGRVAEGAPWVLEASRELLGRDSADRALAPLRTLFEADPTNRECRALLNQARRSSTRVRKLRKNALILMSLAVVTGVAALVKVHVERRRATMLAEVRELIAEPPRARALLNQYFGDDQHPEVLGLREEIDLKHREQELARRNTWSDLYRAAQAECSNGDPMLALQKIIDLPEPPQLTLIKDPWPTTEALYAGITEHMLKDLDALGVPVEGSNEQIQIEDEQEKSVQVLERVTGEMTQSPDVLSFRKRLQEVLARIQSRRDTRSESSRKRAEKALNVHQNELLQDARALTEAGDYERALNRYKELLETDTDGKIGRVLERWVAEVEQKKQSVAEARNLAAQGRHDEAWSLLQATLDHPEKYFVPWHVESFPAGATVEIQGGAPRLTPFDIESTYGAPVRMVFHYEGYDPLPIEVGKPENLFVTLSRTPEREWKSDGRIDALPVAVDQGHLIVDRRGKVACIAPEGRLIWQQNTSSVSGFARSPVALPARPGHLLAVSEDGRAWIIGVESGEVEGPWDLHSTPFAGPYPVQDTVCVRLATGELASFQSRLRPTVASAAQSTEYSSLDDRYRYGVDGGLAVLRRGVQLDERLASPWNGWVAQVKENVYRVFPADDPQGGYAVRKDGEWSYLAWEAPHQGLEQGRLWISDGAGLRAFVP